MFSPKTERLKKLAEIYPDRISELEGLFDRDTKVYLDWSNMYHWSSRLGWRVDLKRLKQFFDSFTTVKAVNLYNGTLEGDEGSMQFMADATKFDYIVVTKPVKIMHQSLDVTGIPGNSPSVLENFIKKPLLQKLSIETVEYLNGRLKELNDRGIKHVEVRKCNFDGESRRDMLLDYERGNNSTFILWSGDSDFSDPVSQLIKDRKEVFIFSTSRRVSSELQSTGAPIFDIQKIRNFICEAKDIQPEIKSKLQ